MSTVYRWPCQARATGACIVRVGHIFARKVLAAWCHRRPAHTGGVPLTRQNESLQTASHWIRSLPVTHRSHSPCETGRLSADNHPQPRCVTPLPAAHTGVTHPARRGQVSADDSPLCDVTAAPNPKRLTSWELAESRQTTSRPRLVALGVLSACSMTAVTPKSASTTCPLPSISTFSPCTTQVLLDLAHKLSCLPNPPACCSISTHPPLYCTSATAVQPGKSLRHCSAGDNLLSDRTQISCRLLVLQTWSPEESIEGLAAPSSPLQQHRCSCAAYDDAGLQTSSLCYLHVAMDAAALVQVGQPLQNCLGNGGHHCEIEALQGHETQWQTRQVEGAAVRATLCGTAWVLHLHAVARQLLIAGARTI